MSLTLVATAVSTGIIAPVASPAAEVWASVKDLGPSIQPPGSSTAVRAGRGIELVGFEWTGGPGSIEVRVRDRGRWSGWTEVQGGSDEGPDPGTREFSATRRTAGPVWVGRSIRDLEVRVEDGHIRRLRVHMISSDPATARGGVDAAGAFPAQPGITTRAQWGADESWRTVADGCDGSVAYASGVRNAFVHHTDNVNTYTADEAPALIRGIYRFHTFTNGWCDIGYNFLIDRYGRIYEGRYGGVDRAVIGAHTGGFNTGATGVSLLGEFGSATVPTAMRQSLTNLLSWKLGLHRVDPRRSVQVTSAGSSRFPAGTVVTLSTISGHRDASLTACPGNNAYALLPQLRVDVQRAQLASPPDPLPTWKPATSGPGLLALNAYGGVLPAGSQAALTHTAYWPGFAIARTALRLPGGAVIVDGYGGLHRLGSALPPPSTAYWPGWDIVRSIARGGPAGTAIMLDGHGGLHGLGTVVPPGGPYFGWDIARGVVTTPSGLGGYVLDGYGGLHRFGDAAPVTGTAYWPRWDIARALALRPDGRSGWVLDAYGGLHPFGGAPAMTSPHYTSGVPIARSLALTTDGGGGWMLDLNGDIWTFGNAPTTNPSFTYTGTGLGRVLLGP